MQNLYKFLANDGIELTEKEFKDLLSYLDFNGEDFCLEGGIFLKVKFATSTEVPQT
jgi:hypothetical protein